MSHGNQCYNAEETWKWLEGTLCIDNVTVFKAWDYESSCCGPREPRLWSHSTFCPQEIMEETAAIMHSHNNPVSTFQSTANTRTLTALTATE